VKRRDLTLLPLATSYIATIVIVRTGFFIIEKFGLPQPGLVIAGVHLHHYIFGVGILSIVSLLAIHQKYSKSSLASLLGFCLALIMDEFQFLIDLDNAVYQTASQLNVISVLGFFFLFGAILEEIRFQNHQKYQKSLQVYPFISVVVPAYNEGKILIPTLKTLKKQNYKGQYEIIVVDNNSTDETAQIAKKMGAKVIFEPKKGTAAARQAGFLAAKGEIIASTDADTIVPRDWLNRFAYEFAKHKDAVVISGMYTFHDGSLILRALTGIFNYPLFTIFGWYSGANMAVKKDVFRASGGFDTDIKLSEDSVLCQKLRSFGKVYRFNSFKVKTTARRFNQLGLLAGLWNYSHNYIQWKLGKDAQKVNFKPGSEVSRLGLKTKILINLLVALAIAGGLFGIQPVRANVIKGERLLNHSLRHIHPKIAIGHHAR